MTLNRTPNGHCYPLSVGLRPRSASSTPLLRNLIAIGRTSMDNSYNEQPYPWGHWHLGVSYLITAETDY